MKPNLQHELLAIIDLLAINNETLYTVALNKLIKLLSKLKFKYTKVSVPLDEYDTLKINLAVDLKVAAYNYFKIIQPPYIVNHKVDTETTILTYSNRFSSVINHINTMDYYYGVLSHKPNINIKAIGDTW